MPGRRKRLHGHQLERPEQKYSSAPLRLERVVTFITIGLIVFVAALNILISLIMMVMEKTKDIAVLMSLGTKRAQIRRIFIAQGMLIGVLGTAIGLVLGTAIGLVLGYALSGPEATTTSFPSRPKCIRLTTSPSPRAPWTA